MNTSVAESERSAIEILQHYGAEGNNPLAALGQAYSDRHSELSVSNVDVPVTTLRLNVKSRMLGANPPDLWVEWPGKNLAPTVDAGVVADVTDVWTDNGLGNAYVEGARDAARFDDRYRCLPLDLYHINNLFYNVDLVERAGVDVTDVSTPSAFLESLATLDQELDVPAISLNGKDPFGTLQLWESFFLAYGGRAAYEALVGGRAMEQKQHVRRAVEALDRTLSHAADDVNFVSSTEADGRFIDGRAAVTHNGGWAVGRFRSASGFEYGEQWGYTAFPGTDEYYQMNMNSIVAGNDLEGDETVESFLSYLSGRDALGRITAELGAVPPRADVPVDELHPVTQEHTNALDRTAYHAPSMTHGLGVPPETLISMKETIAEFMATGDVEGTSDALVRTLSR